jgi:hypothetical protein
MGSRPPEVGDPRAAPCGKIDRGPVRYPTGPRSYRGLNLCLSRGFSACFNSPTMQKSL